MLSISKDKIDSLFELIGSKQPLYLPVDNNACLLYTSPSPRDS